MKTTTPQPPQYPFATITGYGPDNKTATKLVVGIFKRPGKEEPDPMHRWFKPDGGADKDPTIAAEIAAFLKQHGVKRSILADLSVERNMQPREAAYKLVQDAAMKTWEVKHAGRDDADFVQQHKADPAVAKHFKSGELEKLCSLDFHFKEVNSRFKKLGL